jgi:hypothetical protein
MFLHMSLIILLITSSSGLRSAEPGSFYSVLHDKQDTSEADQVHARKGQKGLSKKEGIASSAAEKGNKNRGVTLLVNQLFTIDGWKGKFGPCKGGTVLGTVVFATLHFSSPNLVLTSLLVK